MTTSGLGTRGLVLRGRARGHVVGPKGRPRSGCRPEAVPGPACPWACGSRSATWSVDGSRRSGRGGPAGPSGHVEVAGFLGPARSHGEKRGGSIPIAADPRRSESGARRRKPFASGWRLPLTPGGPPGRDDGGRRSVSRACAASRRLRPLGLMFSNPLRLSRSAFCERPHGRTGCRGGACVLPVLVEIHQLVLRGRARGHVGGPKGRPRSGCRPAAVPGPACPWACGSRSAWWCVVGSRRSLDGAGRRVLGAR